MSNQRSRSLLPNGPSTRSSRNMELPLSKEPDDCSDWLPPGWFTEVKTRKSGGSAGVKYKVYTETSTGNTFYSKPEVTRYLKGKEQSTSSSDKKKSGGMGDSLINGSVRTLRHHNHDREQELPQHQKSEDEKKQPSKIRKDVPQHQKSDDGKKQPLKIGKDVPQHQKSDDGKKQPLKMGKDVPQHQKSDDGKKQPLKMGKEVPQHPKSDEEKSQPSKMREEVPQHPKSDDEISQSLKVREKGPQHPKSDDEKSQSLKVREEVPQHPKSDDEKRQPLKMREKGPQHPKSDDEKSQSLKVREEVPQHPKSDDEKRQPLKMREVIVEKVIDEELPPGWIKEIRTKKYSNGTRRDMFYNDTTTGYVFRSRSDVDRFLETGKISKHAYKRKDGCRNILQSMQDSPSAATLRSNNTKGKESLEGSSLPNHCNSKVGDTGRETVLARNDAVLDIGADVDFIPIESQTPEGNENNVVRMASEPKISERKLKRNGEEMVSSRRSSKRLAGVEIEHVTHSLAIETILRLANKRAAKSETMPSSGPEQAEKCQQAPQANNVGSQEEIICHHTESATVPSKKEFVEAEQSKDNKEEFGKSGSLRKPERNRKRSSKLLAGIGVQPATHPIVTPRVLRSASNKSAKIEHIPSLRSEQGEQAKGAPMAVNTGSQEEMVCQYPKSTSKPVKNVICQYTESATVPVKSVVGQYTESATVPVKSVVGQFTESATVPVKSVVGQFTESATVSVKSVVGQYTESAAAPVKNAVCQYTESATVPVKNVVLQYTESATVSVKNVVCQYTESATLPVKNQLLEAERIKDKEGCEKQSSRRREMKPRRKRKERVSPDQSLEQLAGIEVEPLTNSKPSQRVLRSATAKTEVVSSLGSVQGEQKEPLVINSQEIGPAAASILPEDKKAKATDKTVMIDFSWNATKGQMAKESPRNNVEDQRMKEPPKNNSKEQLTADELATVSKSNGREKEVQDSHLSFPWSDPCIEFAYKTLTGSLPLDDTLAIHDYVQHQIRTSSNTIPDSRPSFSLNTIPSNSSNSITFPDPGPPGFSRGGIHPTFPDARPPGFPRNVTLPNSGNDLAFPDARPPGFAINTSVPSNSGMNHSIPDVRPPGFPINTSLPSRSGINHSIPDVRPPGFPRNIVPSNSSINHSISDVARPHRFSLNDFPSNSCNSLALPDSGPPGFSRSSISPNRGNNLPIPDGTPPGFSRNSSNIPTNSSNNFAVPDARPPGFSWSSSIPSKSVNIPAIPDTKPPGFPWSNSSPNNSNIPALPNTKPPGFPWSNVPSNNGSNNSALPDAKPPGFPWSSVSPNSGINNHPLPVINPPGFPWSSSGNNPSLLDTNQDINPPGFPWSSIPPNSGNNLTLPWSSIRPNSGINPTLPWSSIPPNSGNNPTLPWSSVPSSSGLGINLNVALTDTGPPPGFSQKMVPSSKQQQHQINPADSLTQPADFSMFWNHRN